MRGRGRDPTVPERAVTMGKERGVSPSPGRDSGLRGQWFYCKNSDHRGGGGRGVVPLTSGRLLWKLRTQVLVTQYVFKIISWFIYQRIFFHMTFSVLTVKFSISFHPSNHKWDLHIWVWSCSCGQIPALVQAKVYVRNEFLSHLTVEKPSPRHQHPYSGWHPGPEGANHVASGYGPGAGAISSQSLPVCSVARTGPLTNYFSQQGYFSNFVFVGGCSRLGYSLGWLHCPHCK